MSTLGVLRSRHPQPDPGSFARELWNKDRLNPEITTLRNISEYRAVVYRAFDAFALGKEMMENPEVAQDIGRYHGDPTMRPGEGQYSYRVTVTVKDGNARVATGAVTVTSNMPLNYEEVRAQAIDVILSDSAERDYRNTIGAAINVTRTTEVYVIAAGRQE